MKGTSGSHFSSCKSASYSLQPLASRRRLILPAIAAISLIFAQQGIALSALYTLTDLNATVEFDTSTQSNSYDWFVDGVSHLTQQAFWYRVGNTAEQSLDTIPNVHNAVDANFNPGLDKLNIRYTQAGSFQIDVGYELFGGAPGGTAGLNENIVIKNLSGSTLDFHFFQYSDFDLAGTAGNDGVIFTNSNAVQQFDGVIAFSEAVISPTPSHRELGFYPATLNKLNDGGPTTLTDTPTGLPLGPADVTWAYQWDFSIPAGGSVSIGKTKNITNVPEPGSALLLGLSALTLLGMRARRRMA